jgi:penicillin-binding protein 2
MAVRSPSRRVQANSGWAISDPSNVRRRFLICAVGLAAVFSLLLGRLWYLQVVRGTQMLAQAKENRLRDVPLSAPRGLILDRNGAVLATSRTTHSVAVVPAALPSARREPEARIKVLRTLGFLVGQTPAQIENKLVEAVEAGGRPYDPVRVGNDIDLKTITRIEENRARLGPAVLVTDNIQRAYPNGDMAAHVLGYTGIVTARDLERDKASETPRDLKYDDILGKIGVEKEYDRLLTGLRGSEQYEVDSRGRPVRKRGSIVEKPGQSLVLTIDAKLQKAAEDALDRARNSGAAVVIDPRNGEVLAMASRPTFNSNVFSLPKKEFQSRWLAYNNNKKHPLINRAAGGPFPPASTFKMLTAIAGLERGTLNPETRHTCTGGLRMGRYFGCWGTHGSVNLAGALAKSCNVYFYQEALKLGNPESSGPDYLAKVAREFGLGQETGIDLPVDNDGLIPDTGWRKQVNKTRPDLARWFPGNTLNMSIGQGDVLATPLQMALVTSTVANGGTLWKPHLFKEIRDAQTGKVLQRAQPQLRRKVSINPQNLALVRAGLRGVVTNGTGKIVAMPHVAVAGKTGSAEDANNPLPNAWFVAFAPYENPRIAIAVIIENSGHGGENAGPVAKAILNAAFPEPKSD